MILCGMVVFFQAEDGIRDLVRSRGLGDVYKRQVQRRGGGRQPRVQAAGIWCPGVGQKPGIPAAPAPVSYTHLTLPTSDLV